MASEAAHKFKVGATVRFVKGNPFTAKGSYQIVQTLPALAGDFHYRIKSAAEQFERTVNERDLVRAA